MYVEPHFVFKWLHIVAFVYWLGGEWGVFQTSFNVLDTRLTLQERRRHMETAYRIDILARSGILLLFPIGFEMGATLGAHPYADLVGPVWLFYGCWLALTWSAFLRRETNLGLLLTRIDERIRYAVIPLLFGLSLWSLVGDGPFTAGWFAAKVLIYSLLLVIGLALRFVMRHWTTIFRELDRRGPGSAPELELRLSREGVLSRGLAYLYWIGILSVAFIGTVKPF